MGEFPERNPPVVRPDAASHDRHLRAQFLRDAREAEDTERLGLRRALCWQRGVRAQWPEEERALEARALDHPNDAEVHVRLAIARLGRGAAATALEAARRAAASGEPDGLLLVAMSQPTALTAEDVSWLERHEQGFPLAAALSRRAPEAAHARALARLRTRDVPAAESTFGALEVASGLALAGRGELAHEVLLALRERVPDPEGAVGRSLRALAQLLFVGEPFPPAARRALALGLVELAYGHDSPTLDELRRRQPMEAVKARNALARNAPELERALGAQLSLSQAKERETPWFQRWGWLLLLGTCVGVKAIPRIAQSVNEGMEAMAAELVDPSTGWETEARSELRRRACESDDATCALAEELAISLSWELCEDATTEARQLFATDSARPTPLFDEALRAELQAELDAVCGTGGTAATAHEAARPKGAVLGEGE
jgi:hypothetical protein